MFVIFNKKNNSKLIYLIYTNFMYFLMKRNYNLNFCGTFNETSKNSTVTLSIPVYSYDFKDMQSAITVILLLDLTVQRNMNVLVK